MYNSFLIKKTSRNGGNIEKSIQTKYFMLNNIEISIALHYLL